MQSSYYRFIDRLWPGVNNRSISCTGTRRSVDPYTYWCTTMQSSYYRFIDRSWTGVNVLSLHRRLVICRSPLALSSWSSLTRCRAKRGTRSPTRPMSRPRTWSGHDEVPTSDSHNWPHYFSLLARCHDVAGIVASRDAGISTAWEVTNLPAPAHTALCVGSRRNSK